MQSNLKVIRTEIEAREKGRAGGIASGIARRMKKTLRETLSEALKTKNDKGLPYLQSIAVSLLQEAEKGNVRAFEVIRDTIGEKPTEKHEITSLTKEIAELKAKLLKKNSYDFEDLPEHIREKAIKEAASTIEDIVKWI